MFSGLKKMWGGTSATVTQQGTTFAVEKDLEIGPQLKRVGDDALSTAWRSKGHIEAMSPAPSDQVEVFATHNLFASAVHQAFYGHYPLVLSPDVIWLTIVQGLANHVDQNAEALRSKFVDFDGKKELVVDRPGFVKGSPDNDWPGVFPEFESQIAQNIGAETTEMLAGTFSTTGPNERVASVIALMDTVQHYFTYTMRCGCGFPSITLKGTADDWRAIRSKAQGLKKFEIDFWLDELLPLLDQFVTAAEGKPDLDFWRSLCNKYGGSGIITGPITGWLQCFFPYLNNSECDRGYSGRDATKVAEPGKAKKEMRKNGAMAAYRRSMAAKIGPTNFKKDGFRDNGCDGGLELKNIPPGLSSAPLKYIDLANGGKIHQMAFMGGVTSLVQHKDTGALEPKVGWCVIERQEKKMRSDDDFE